MTSLNPWSEPLPAPLESLNLYVAIIPDRLPSLRAQFRAEHSIEALDGERLGWIVDGGSRAPENTGASSAFLGSWLLIREVSAPAARARLTRDAYGRNGVWDLDQMQVWASISERRLFDCVPESAMEGSVDARRA